MMSRFLATSFAAFILGVTASCSGDDAVTLQGVTVQLESAGSLATTEAAQDVVLSELSALPKAFEVRDGDEARPRLLVSVLEASVAQDKRSARVYVYAVVQGKEILHRGHGLAEEATDGSASIQGLFPALFRSAVRAALRDIQTAVVLGGQSSSALLKNVETAGTKPVVLMQSLRILGQRQEKGAVDALLPILDAPDGAVAAEAVMALSEIGDTRAVLPIIDFADGKPPSDRKLAVRAVETLGTDEGMAWLFTMSTGHPDTSVQLEARRAFNHLQENSSSNAKAKAKAN